jgi:LmbE family N-acetylglucosaminyl deacetylase
MSPYRHRTLALSLCLLFAAPVFAQRDLSGAAQIEQSLQKLNQLGSVLMVAAHPDDENNSVVAYFSRGRHMRMGYLSCTRGEGGQNLIGSELGDLLGVIRTQELLAARRVDGGEQFFTRAVDFGFSKSPQETLDKWGREKVLSDVVWAIRRFRPDVVVMTFSGTPRDGHGQHQASAMLGREAFTAAGDPARFPEQLRYVQPWSPKRAVQSLYASFMRPEGAKETLFIDPGEYNPILGAAYTEIGGMSRSMHRSQAMGSPERRGASSASFVQVAGASAEHDLFDGIETTWKRFPGGAAVGAILDGVLRTFEPAHPEKSVARLATARPLIAAIHDPLAAAKLVELDEAIALCTGLWADAQAARYEVAPGGELGVTVSLLNRSSIPIAVESARVEGFWNEALTPPAGPLPFNQTAKIEFAKTVPANQPYSQPYWLAAPRQGDLYTVNDQTLIGLAEAPPVLRVRLRCRIAGVTVELVRPVQHRYVDRGQGERVRPLAIVPAVAVDLPQHVVMFPDAAPRRVQVSVRANSPNAKGELRLEVQSGWKVEPAAHDFAVAVAGEQQDLTFEVTPPAGEATSTLRAIARTAAGETAAGLNVILYPHIPAQTVFPRAEGKLVRAAIQVKARRVGYIMGAGDQMPEAIRQLGCEVTLLSRSDLEQRNLAEFDAIVAGVRAYNVRPDIAANQPRLLEYVRNGGTYIVQYNTLDSALPALGPYPFTVTHDRVAVEDAPVVFTQPDSPLLQAPNQITGRDFAGWIQERGLYFASQWDPQYQTAIEAHDPGERPHSGGLLWTRYGKGIYIFTGYSWFRELPAGVPGAYRLFANLLSAK